MTHVLAVPVCDCRCGCCRRWHQPGTQLALNAAQAVDADPYPFLIPEPTLGILPDKLSQTRECEYPGCGRTVRGPLIPVEVDGVIRKVGRGCARKAFDAERPGLADQLLPMLPEGAE